MKFISTELPFIKNDAWLIISKLLIPLLCVKPYNNEYKSQIYFAVRVEKLLEIVFVFSIKFFRWVRPCLSPSFSAILHKNSQCVYKSPDTRSGRYNSEIRGFRGRRCFVWNYNKSTLSVLLSWHAHTHIHSHRCKESLLSSLVCI